MTGHDKNWYVRHYGQADVADPFAERVGLADLLTGGNYLFLARPPATPTLLSLLGPWPWYPVGAAVIALALILLLELPFRWQRRSRGARSSELSRRAPQPRR